MVIKGKGARRVMVRKMLLGSAKVMVSQHGKCYQKAELYRTSSKGNDVLYIWIQAD